MKYNPFDDDMLATKIPLRALLVPGCLIGIQITASLLYIFVSDLTLKSFVLFGVGTSLKLRYLLLSYAGVTRK